MIVSRTAETIAEDVAGAVEQVKDNYTSQLGEFFEAFPSKAVVFGIKVLVALLLFLIGQRLIRLVVRLAERSMERAGTEITVRRFVKYLLRALGYIFLVIVILSVAGVQPTAFATVASSVTVALGLALQGSLANFAGGLLILVLKPFKVGDYIIEDTNKNEGTVRNIGLVYTELVTMDNRVITVPNGNLANSSMTNVTAQERRRLDLKVGISYKADLKRAKELLVELMEAEPGTMKEEEHFAYVSELADSAVIVGCRCWVRTEDYWKCRWDLTEAIKEAYDREGIEIPYGQLDVHIREK